MPLSCRIFGHRYRFAADGETMRWTCGRCGVVGGEKRYDSAAEARRYARAFDREDSDDLGRRAPLVAGIGLRAIRLLRRRASSRRRSRAGR